MDRRNAPQDVFKGSCFNYIVPNLKGHFYVVHTLGLGPSQQEKLKRGG
jgi:hypothetical protein